MAQDFVHLHCHTQYSILDGLAKIPDMLTAVQKNEQKAMAITEHGVMYSALHFYNAARKAEIKAIIGLEAYMAKGSRFDKQTKMGADQAHITLLAQTFQGYQNLHRLTTIANFEGFSYKPRIDEEVLFKYSQGLIVTSGCMSSIFNRLLLAGKEEEAIEKFKVYKEQFAGRFYVEIQNHPGVENLAELTIKQIEIAKKLDLPLVATNDVHYANKDDADAQDALLCVQTRRLISDTHRMTMMNSPDYYLRSTQEMVELFKETPEAITNTLVIAEQCNVEIPTGQLIFPDYPLEKGETATSALRKLAYQGLKKRFPIVSSELEERVEYELKVIDDKGYSAYFLITQDFVNWAKAQGIGVGPGRGSAAGSLISYAIGITDIDPIYHGLAFERFLNPQRPTPPDIDMDFADDRREEVIDYVAKKYGEENVGHVITFGKMEARVAIRDIGRVLGMPYEDPDKIAKLIPNDPGKKTSLQQAIDTVPELAQYYKQPNFKKLMDLAMKVEGSIRHSSVHAAALIITDKPLHYYCAIQKDSKTGKAITQFDMYALDCNISDDALGLLKFDFLGLRNLSIIQAAVALIKKHKNIDLNVSTLPLDDKKTYALLSAGETMGVFQLESSGMRRVARSLRPNQFSDITAMVALYRPGPMDLIPQFIEGKHNPSSIHYPHESLEPVLKETYGIMVYQEQILLIANIMAGYTLGEADILRRAIGKKKKYLLDENKKRFVSQSIEKKYTKETAEKVWGFIEAFANYGFNKAHAASYAMISYQTAYLKANYPVEYMTALMSVESASHSMNRDIKIAVAVEDCKKMGIKMFPPDVNTSEDDFTIEEMEGSLESMAIRFGFTAIKHVGTQAIENLLETRKRVGTFTSLTQFIHETDSRKVNKTTLECLIKVGAMDIFGTRASMLENLEQIRQTAAQLKFDDQGQDSLFSDVQADATAIKDTFPSVPEYQNQELLSFEKELLGLFLTNHPMAAAMDAVSSRATKTIGELDNTIHTGQIFLFGGVITQLRQIQTKKTGALMAFGKLEDRSGVIDITIFPKTYEKYQNVLQQDKVVLLKAKVDFRDEELQLLVEKVSVPDSIDEENVISDMHKEIFIPRKTDKAVLQELGTMLKNHPGSESVIILIPNGGQPHRMLLPYTVKWNEELEGKIAQLLG